MSLRIINLQAENFKRLVTIDITPDNNLVVLSGKNHQGKTSILDAIFAALKGSKFARETSASIREGHEEDGARVRLEIGDQFGVIKYIATRRWKKNDSGTLTVEAADGTKYKSPQTLLDDIVGEISFDALAFLDMKASEQVEALVKALGKSLPFDPAELAAERKAHYDQRTTVNAEVKRLEGQLSGFAPFDPALPTVEVPAAAVLAEIDEARKHNDSVDGVAASVAQLDGAVERARAAFEQAKAAVIAVEAEAETWRNHLAAAPAKVDTVALTEKLSGLEVLNAKVRAQNQRLVVAEALAINEAASQERTAAIEAIDKKKADGIAAASFPVPELSFDDSGVTFNGRAFSQASTEEQIRASFGVAITANPDLRVCRIDKGEALDSDALRLLGGLAAEHDMQVWISRVDESGTVGFVIEEGAVRA